MTRRMRLSRYGAIALWALAQCAFSTPSRVPDPPPAPQGIANAGGGHTGQPDPAQAANALQAERALHEQLVDVMPLDAGTGGGGGHSDGTRVAEPSTLLLVSFGVFGLIAWNRRRR